MPKAIVAQLSIGFVTAFAYMIAIFYAINNLDSVLSGSATFPLAEIYHQATGSSAGTIGLLLVILLPLICTNIGLYLTASRMVSQAWHLQFSVRCTDIDLTALGIGTRRCNSV